MIFGSPYHGVQCRVVLVVNFFRIFEIIIFCFVVAISDLVHYVEVIQVYLITTLSLGSIETDRVICETVL